MRHFLVFVSTLPAAPIDPLLNPGADIVAKIESLPANTWLKLPPPKIAGDLSWCGKPNWPGTENISKFGPGVRDIMTPCTTAGAKCGSIAEWLLRRPAAG